jgi:hypothetical protein
VDADTGLAANEPVPDLVRKLNDWQPEMFAGYPTILRVLAEEQLAGRLRVHPHFVMSGSEVLTDEPRRRVEAAWGQVLFEAYGTTESGGGWPRSASATRVCTCSRTWPSSRWSTSTTAPYQQLDHGETGGSHPQDWGRQGTPHPIRPALRRLDALGAGPGPHEAPQAGLDRFLRFSRVGA